MALKPEQLRPLLREMVRHLGAKRAVLEYFGNGLPPPKMIGGPHMRIVRVPPPKAP